MEDFDFSTNPINVLKAGSGVCQQKSAGSWNFESSCFDLPVVPPRTYKAGAEVQADDAVAHNEGDLRGLNGAASPSIPEALNLDTRFTQLIDDFCPLPVAGPYKRDFVSALARGFGRIHPVGIRGPLGKAGALNSCGFVVG